MKLLSKVVYLHFIFAFLVSCLIISNDNLHAEVQKPNIKIGVIAPLTGGLAERGDDIAKLLPFIKEELESLNLKNSYEFVLEDGKCGAGNAAITSAMKFINIDGIKYIITGCSGETLQIAPLVEKNKVVTIASLSVHPDVKHAGDYVFRTYLDVDPDIKSFSNYLTSNCDAGIAILTEENAFTFGLRDMLMKSCGSKVVYTHHD